jgi:hypothetical protein
VNEVYLFLLAITLGFGFALGGVLARLLERLVRFELRIRESRRRLLLKLDVDREMNKVAAGVAREGTVTAESPFLDLKEFKLAPAEQQPKREDSPVLIYDGRGGQA